MNTSIVTLAKSQIKKAFKLHRWSINNGLLEVILENGNSFFFTVEADRTPGNTRSFSYMGLHTIYNCKYRHKVILVFVDNMLNLYYLGLDRAGNKGTAYWATEGVAFSN